MTIADNKKAFFDYFIEERYEAGIVLEGWEVKAIRAGRVQIKEGYVVVRDAEMFLIGAHISPLQSASTHVNPDPVRTRKLLLKADEIKKLIGKVEQRGYTLVPLNLHYTRGRVKCEIGLAKGEAVRQARDREEPRLAAREGAPAQGRRQGIGRRRGVPTRLHAPLLRTLTHPHAPFCCPFTICSAEAIIPLISPGCPARSGYCPAWRGCRRRLRTPPPPSG